MAEKNQYEIALERSAIPPYMHGLIIRWITAAIPPGNFLSAVLCNDLREACSRADDTNRPLIAEYVSWFYSHAPAPCWGSTLRYNTWIKDHVHLTDDEDEMAERDNE